MPTYGRIPARVVGFQPDMNVGMNADLRVHPRPRGSGFNPT